MSAGTRRTIGHVIGQPLVAYEEGALVDSRFGATTRRVRFPFGETGVVEWSGTEPLTVPRHTRTARVRSYVRAPRAAAAAGRVAQLGAPFMRAAALAGSGPAPSRRARTAWTVIAEARAPGRGRRAILSGRDVYGLTALLVVRAAEALRSGEIGAAGALAPAEAFDPRALLARLVPLAETPSTEEI
jgi:hypothetical protein